MSSPLERLRANKPPVQPTAQKSADTDKVLQSMFAATVSGKNDQLPATSPLSKMAKPVDACPHDLRQQFKLPVTGADIDAIGADTSKNVGTVTDRITERFSTASFGELGDILYNVQTQANSLNADDLMKGGVIGWIRRKGADVKSLLVKRMQTASAAFDELEGKMTDQHTMLQTWEKDLDTLYKENYQNYLSLRRDLDRAEKTAALIKMTIGGWPVIAVDDPDAFMKGQLLAEAQALQNDAEIKCDTLRRQIVMCEVNGPDLTNRIRASESQRRTLTRMINEVIPMVKREFAKFLQTLEMQKSIKLVDSARDMGDQALRLSADSSRDAALAAAKSANTPIVSTETLNHLRTRMLETVTGVQQIEADAQKQREADEQQMKQQQAALLNQLQKRNAI